MTRIKAMYKRLFYFIFFSMFFRNTSMVLHSRPGAGGGTPVRTGCSGNRPPNRLISSEVLLPLLRSNYGAHLDSLTTKRRELARLDLWQVVIRWRLFFYPGKHPSCRGARLRPRERATRIERGVAYCHYYNEIKKKRL